MKRIISEDGTRNHELTVPQKRALLKAMEVVEELAFFYRDTAEGEALKELSAMLEGLHSDSFTLCAKRVEMAKKLREVNEASGDE